MQEGRRQKGGGRSKETLFHELFNLFQLDNYFSHAALVSKLPRIKASARNIATDARNIVTDARNIVTDARNIVTDARNIVTDARNIATDARNIATDARNIATDARNIATDARNIATDARNIATDARNIASLLRTLLYKHTITEKSIKKTWAGAIASLFIQRYSVLVYKPDIKAFSTPGFWLLTPILLL